MPLCISWTIFGQFLSCSADIELSQIVSLGQDLASSGLLVNKQSHWRTSSFQFKASSIKPRYWLAHSLTLSSKVAPLIYINTAPLLLRAGSLLHEKYLHHSIGNSLLICLSPKVLVPSFRTHRPQDKTTNLKKP